MTTRDAIEDQIEEIAVDHAAEIALGHCDTGAAVAITMAVTAALCVPELRLPLWPLSVLSVGGWWLLRPTLREQMVIATRRYRRGATNEHA